MSQIPSDAFRRARRAEVRYPRCPVCSSGDVNGLHVERCTQREALWRAAAAHIEAADVPTVTGQDLWAHLNSRTHNELISTRVVQLVLDLGWRPVVGSDPALLWQKGDRA